MGHKGPFKMVFAHLGDDLLEKHQVKYCAQRILTKTKPERDINLFQWRSGSDQAPESRALTLINDTHF